MATTSHIDLIPFLNAQVGMPTEHDYFFLSVILSSGLAIFVS